MLVTTFTFKLSVLRIGPRGAEFMSFPTHHVSPDNFAGTEKAVQSQFFQMDAVWQCRYCSGLSYSPAALPLLFCSTLSCHLRNTTFVKAAVNYLRKLFSSCQN